MGRVSEAALYQKVETKCGMSSDMHKDMDHCCDDEWALEIIDDVQSASDYLKAPTTTYSILAEVFWAELQFDDLDAEIDILKNDTGPPLSSYPELYLFYSNIKIPSELQS